MGPIQRDTGRAYNEQISQVSSMMIGPRFLFMFYVWDSYAVPSTSQRTSLHKGVLVVPEYFNNILIAYSHIKGTCIGEKFELNGLLVW